MSEAQIIHATEYSDVIEDHILKLYHGVIMLEALPDVRIG